MMRNPFGQTPGIYENQRGAMLRGQYRKSIVDFSPHFVGSYCAQLAAGNFDGEIQFPAVPDLYNHRIGAIAAGQKMSDEFDWFLRGGQAYASYVRSCEVIETLERKSKVCAAFVVRYGMDFVHDDRFDVSEHFAAFRRRQQNVEGFRRGCRSSPNPCRADKRVTTAASAIAAAR